MTQYWQITAGSGGRNYSKYFLKYGIAFVGGKVNEARMKKIKKGDIVVLKEVGKEMKAAGKVVGEHGCCGDKEWLKDFDGWALPAYCYVDWRVLRTGFRTYRSRTIERIWNETIRERAWEICDRGDAPEKVSEPQEIQKVEVGEMLECLMKAGLKASKDELGKSIRRILDLANDYYPPQEFGWDWILEHETRTFLVAPLLLALGWSERQIKIELGCDGGKVDIALFRENFKNDKNDCVAVIETKAFHIGLDYADKQAEVYAKNFTSCETLITTNGHCYKIYKKDGKNFKEHAYMNLLKPTKKYPIDPNVDGALEALKWLLPNSYPG